MKFNSVDYILFLIIFGFLYFSFSANKKIFLRNVLLLIFSYIFYSWESLYLIFFILYSSIIDFFIGKWIYNSKKQKTKKNLLYLSLILNLGMLFVVKYLSWIINSINITLNSLIGTDFLINSVEIVLPPGISFYTFQTLSYTIEIYRNNFKPEKNPLNYFNYVSFFPQLIAGPIERPNKLLPQLNNHNKTVSPEMIKQGIILITWGLVKKIVFADNFGNIVSFAVNGNLGIPGIGYFTVLAFSLQIYMDFSAYTDIARGSAKLFGIDLSRNFKTPYFAASPTDFWKRWHISLSQWIRDYIYIPLGGNKGKNIDYIRNILIAMGLCGLWHGAGGLFFIWGIYHGMILILYKYIPIDQFLVAKFKAFGKILAIFIMYHLTLLGWIFFMSDNISQTLSIGFSNFKIFYEPIDPKLFELIYTIFIFAIPIFLFEMIAYLKDAEFSDILVKINKIKFTFFLFASFYLIVFIGKRDAYDFIYFAF